MDKKTSKVTLGTRHGKKALSPVIATVLLIMLALSLIAIIIFWVSGFFSEQLEKNGSSVKDICKNIQFDIEGEVNYNTNKIDMIVVNKGNVIIYGLELKTIGGGNSNSASIKNLNIKKDDTKDVDNFSFDEGAERIIIYPVILGKVKGKNVNKPSVCRDISKVIVIKN